MNRPTKERESGNELRERLRAEQGNRCHWCDVEMEDAAWGYPRPPLSVTLDHVTPRSCGGELSEANCVAACHQCNDRRNVEFWQARAPIQSKIDKAIRRMTPAEVEERLGRIAEALR